MNGPDDTVPAGLAATHGIAVSAHDMARSTKSELGQLRIDVASLRTQLKMHEDAAERRAEILKVGCGLFIAIAIAAFMALMLVGAMIASLALPDVAP